MDSLVWIVPQAQLALDILGGLLAGCGALAARYSILLFLKSRDRGLARASPSSRLSRKTRFKAKLELEARFLRACASICFIFNAQTATPTKKKKIKSYLDLYFFPSKYRLILATSQLHCKLITL